jgi:phytoene desaturase
MGGTGALVRGLADLGVEQGVVLRTRAEVEEITHKRGCVAGVRVVGGETVPADIVVANADPVTVYRDMLPGWKRRRWTDSRLARLAYSMGLYVLFFGTRRRYEDVAHHTILLGDSYRETLEDIFRRKVVPAHPSLYLHRPTATDLDVAPPGCDTFYALVPVPNLQGEVDWDEAEPRMRGRVLDILEGGELPGLRGQLDTAFAMTPADFRDRYRSPYGAGFSIQPLLTQSAWFRFHNRSEELEGLYFAGAGTHPGAGIPGVLSSAKVVENVLRREGRS